MSSTPSGHEFNMSKTTHKGRLLTSYNPHFDFQHTFN